MTDTCLTWILYFAIYSFLGWICETIYCSVPARHFVNRGFLNGPVCPIYGVGGVFTIAVLEPFLSNVFLIFVLGFIWTTALEYITSWAMERLFHYKWWDYSKKFMNIRGRVCLLNSTLFGIMCVLLMFFIHPPIERLVTFVPFWMKITLVSIFLTVFVADLIVTVKAVAHLSERLEKLHLITEEIKSEWKERWEGFEHPSIRFKNLIEENKLFQKRLIRSFPHLHSIRYNEYLTQIKEAIRKLKIKKEDEEE